MKKQALVEGRRLLNSLNLPSHVAGHRLLNANGDIDPASAGYNYIMTTMSYIRSKIVEQKFYEIPFADFMPVIVGEGAWADETIQNITFMSGGSFYEGDVNTQTQGGKLTQSDAVLDKLRQPNRAWTDGVSWNVIEIAMAAFNNRWDIVEAKLAASKKKWDLGLQETAFLGHPNGEITGLLNDGEATINTSLITQPLTEMSETEFTAFVGALLPAYFENANKTALPDTFVMPNSDYLGLGVPFSSSFPNISKLEYMLNMMKTTTGNPNFAIRGLAYCEEDVNSDRAISKNRYALYRNAEDSGAMSVPVDYTLLEADTANKMQWTQGAYGQYSGYLLNRKREMLYIDETAT